ncbi:MAG: class I SAM-dependent methyltransferase [Candidatus Bathyarchaeota archaeon]|nr:class I SAM-dependent methyltransferase [Candidatus Bathyarchaeota archaeon]
MGYPTKRIRFGDCTFDVFEAVYEPAEDSFLFAENLNVPIGATVLDLGTGCGILAVSSAKIASRVIAVDLNPYAIRCAQLNAKRNGLRHKMDFIQADLFTALNPDAAFDLVLFNAPYLPSEAGEEASWIGRAWAGGVDGRQVVDRFISEVPKHLKEAGRVLLMQSTLTGVEATISKFKIAGLHAEVNATQQLPFFETLTLIEAKYG